MSKSREQKDSQKGEGTIMKMRKVVSILLVAAMTIGMVTGCGSSSGKKTAKSDAKGII